MRQSLAANVAARTECAKHFGAAIGQGMDRSEAWAAVRERSEASRREAQTIDGRIDAAVRDALNAVKPLISFHAWREARANMAARNLRWPDGVPLMEVRLRAMLEIADDEATRERVMAVYRLWAEQDDQIVDQAMSAEAHDPTGGGDRLQEARRQRAELEASMPERLQQAGLGELALRADERLGQSDPFSPLDVEGLPAAELRPLVRLATVDAAFRAGENIDRFRMRWPPAPLRRDLIDAWLRPRDGGRNGGGRDGAGAALAAARARWDAEIAPLIAATDDEENRRMSGTAGWMWGADPIPADVFERATTAIEGQIACRRAAEGVDQELFDALAEALDPPLGQSIRLARTERLLELWADGEALLGVATDHELVPNLARLVRTAVPAEQREVAEAILLEEAEALAASARERRRAQVLLGKESELCTYIEYPLRQRAEAGTLTEVEAAIHAELPERIERVHRARWASSRASCDLARRVFDRILAEVPDPAARRALRLAYEAEAYPERFRDPADFAPWFDRAARLPSLDDERRGELTALRERHEARRGEWYLRSIERFRAQPPLQWLRHAVRDSQQFDRLWFERREINARAVHELRLLLTPEERAAVPMLAAYDWLLERVGEAWWK